MYAEDIRNVSVQVWRLTGVIGRTQPDYDICVDLQNARIKTATGNLTNMFKSKDMNEGKHDWNDNGVNPDVHHADGVPVVVRGRESLLHGEGEQFKCLKCKLSDPKR
jgi:hypothetical protein